MKELFIIEKLINRLMFDGKKYLSFSFLNKVFFILNKNEKKGNPYEILLQAIDNVGPLFIIKSQKKGRRRVVTIPQPISSQKLKNFLGIKIILSSMSERKENSLVERFSFEILDAYHNKGISKRKQKQIHTTAFSNKAFIRFY
jgi:small subunit ribosomal protein S7